MKTLTVIALVPVFVCAPLAAAEKMMGHKSPVAGMSKEEQIKLAMSAAPARISRDATIVAMDADGKMTELRHGTNGFTCMPDIDGQERPDPMCGDAAAMQWGGDLLGNKDKPSNTVPGVAYMGRGGWHWEKDGKILMDKDTAGARRVSEPPHWMVFWPFGAADTGLPTLPGKWGTYIMWADTPYAHLMIYQDPNKLP